MALKLSMANQHNQERWEAVVARDAAFDGQFVFAVSSTRVYCRPSCPSRRPHRERVSFFESPDAAESAGYRACLRCKPDKVNVSDPRVELAQKVCRVLDSADESLTLTDLAAHTGVSVFHLQRTFKSVMGISPRQYVALRKIGDFKARVREGEGVTTALYNSGFNSSSRLYEKAAGELGMTPATYSRGGRGADIRYTTTDSPLGRLLVAVTDRGICAVKMADSDEELEGDLREELPAANLQRDDAALRDTVGQVLRFLSDSQPHADLPLDIQATAFQRQVWEKLKAIPYGETRSYADIARSIGKPGAVRAVGSACGKNPVALVIPCHRVVREDKSLGGYRWGLERKKKLLEREREGK
jgi:AraC family transcriptional regulator, regulatory protein of adaptative response / methylated-DNA-[protein]-cysteine methyltransferase